MGKLTYLYIKIHNKTGLKYLGKTSAKDPIKYEGSGKYWKNHINKHGYDVKTVILFSSTDIDEIRHIGTGYSRLLKIVESKRWANLKEENGDGGWEYCNSSPEIIDKRSRWARENNPFIGTTLSEETKQKIRDARAKQIMLPRSRESVEKGLKSREWYKHSEETKQKMSEAHKGIPNPNKGVPLSEEHKRSLSIGQKLRFQNSHGTMKGKKHSEESKNKIKEARAKQVITEEHKRKISESNKGRKGPMKGKTHLEETKKKISESNKGRTFEQVECPHCHKIGPKPQMHQWHFDNCKHKDRTKCA